MSLESGTSFPVTAMRLTFLFNVAIAFLLFTSCAAATDVSIRISNGKTVTLFKTGDVFDRAENERARVTTSGLFDDRERGQIFMRWVFSIHFKQPTMVRNVRVEDVTDEKPVPLIEDDSPNVTADNLGSAPPPIYLEVCVYLFQAGIHGLVDHAQSAVGSFSEDFSGGHQPVSPCRLALNCLLEQ
jgi:hypothetical protein